MINHKYDHLTFTSRNPNIRKADDMARLINKCYPRVSPSYVACSNYIAVFPKLDNNLNNAIRNLRMLQELKESSCLFFKKIRFKQLPKLIKKTKIGNCCESAQLSFIAAKANGYSDVKFADLWSNEIGDLDHMVVLVNDGKKPFVIDSWLGFADYVPEVIEKYKGIYNRLFNLSKDHNGYLEFKQYRYNIKEISSDMAKKLFPELILNNNIPETSPNNVKNPSQELIPLLIKKIKHFCKKLFK